MSIDLKHYSLIIGMKNMGAMYKRSEYGTLKYEEKHIILAAVTYFTLCSIKSWCAAAVEAVH